VVSFRPEIFKPERKGPILYPRDRDSQECFFSDIRQSIFINYNVLFYTNDHGWEEGRDDVKMLPIFVLMTSGAESETAGVPD